MGNNKKAHNLAAKLVYSAVRNGGNEAQINFRHPGGKWYKLLVDLDVDDQRSKALIVCTYGGRTSKNPKETASYREISEISSIIQRRLEHGYKVVKK